MDLEHLTAEQLTAELDRLAVERTNLKAKARQVQAALARRLAEDHAALHGLTAEQYADMKRRAKAEGKDFPTALREARQRAVKEMRELQVARAVPVPVGVTGVK
jgi:hypothetical protein